MKARVPYLARLARQAVGQPLLRPPRPLFAGDADLVVPFSDNPGIPRRPDGEETTPSRAGSLALSGDSDEPSAPRATDPPPARGTRWEPAEGIPSRPVTPLEPVPTATSVRSPAVPASPATATVAGSAAGTVTRPGRPDLSGPPWPEPYRPDAADPELPLAVDGVRTNSPGARPAAPPPEPPPSRRRQSGGAGPGQPPEAWERLWGGPVDLPETAGPAPAAARAGARALPVARAVPAAPPPRSPAVWSALWREDQLTGEARDAGGASAGRDGAGTRGAVRSEEAAADRSPRRAGGVRELMPPPAADSDPAALPAAEPGEPHRRPHASQRPHVSIGTIDVTIVPSATPTPAAAAAREIAFPMQGTPRWSGPSYSLAASASADRLRDGFRRWYGTAQG